MFRRPTPVTLGAICLTYLLQTAAGFLGLGTELFALALPLLDRPWTLVLSVYAHSSLLHLATNAIALLVVGPIVAHLSTPVRFHAFFVTSGSLAGAIQVLLTAPLGPTAVLGASGAIFGLFGYLLIGNRATDAALSWVPFGRRGRLLVVVGLGAALTLATAAPGVALVAHFAGFLIGGVAGRIRLLHAPSRR
ncbi:MAG: rhomboid family intramembrane serine protease [Natronomonas sp.]